MSQGAELEMFSYVDENHIAVAASSSGSQPPRISVIPFKSVRDPTLFRSIHFLLPPPSEDVETVSIDFFCFPEPGWVPHQTRGPPLFHANKEDRIIMVDIRSLVDGTLEWSRFAVPSWKLLSFVQQFEGGSTDVTIPWSEWGPKSTRYVHVADRRSDNICFGTRYITTEGGKAVIYDFNRHTVNRASSMGDRVNGVEPPPVVVCDVSTVNSPVFSETVSTSLPYRKVLTSIEVSESESVGLDEDWIIIVDTVCF